jgi:hypothetical protein
MNMKKQCELGENLTVLTYGNPEGRLGNIQVTSNDYPSTGVGSSDPKRTAPLAGEDIVSSATKVAAVIH